VDRFGWSLHEIDWTDIESLIPFVFRYPDWKARQKGANGRHAARVYADQVDWL
jgi:hypothetical protein